MGEVTSERKESSDGDGGVPAEDQNLMGDEDASLSSTDLHDLINYLNDFDLERASSTSNSSFSPRERALITTLSNNISLINERQLDGGFKTLTHNNLYGSDTNQQAVYGTPATNPFDPPPIVQIAVVAQPGANPFAPSRNISQPHANQMAATTQPQVNLYTADQPQQQHMLMSPTNSFAAMNPFAPSRNISQPHANQMAATTQPQVNLYTADQPQQQHMLMSPTNSFVAMNPFAPSRNISQPHAGKWRPQLGRK
ncbi:hypothetical protein K1719_046480 [Acacia pycnantha]|nr:hypothetical protein K1719_046480 [Acacia pycnantha]